MTHSIVVNDLTPEQVEQIYMMIEAFRTINKQQQRLTEEQSLEFDPSPLFFESEILHEKAIALKHDSNS